MPATPNSENASHLVERRHHRKFQQLRDAELKQQQAGDDAENAENHRLRGGEQFVDPVHCLPLIFASSTASTLHGPAPAVDRYRQAKQYAIASVPPLISGKKLLGACAMK